MRLLMKKREQIGNEGKRQIVYDTEADKSRLRNIWHDNKQDIDFWKKLCIIKQENTQDNKQDGMLRGEKLWQIIFHRLRLQTQCWTALHLYRRKSEK